MKNRTFALMGLIVCLAALAIVVIKSRRPIAAEFCTGLPAGLKSIRIEGQGRTAIITDPQSLSFLEKCPKVEALPVDRRLTGGAFFDACLEGSWLNKGYVAFSISGDKQIVGLQYTKSSFSIPSSTFMLIESNPPQLLIEAFEFLLSDINRGKVWSNH